MLRTCDSEGRRKAAAACSTAERAACPDLICSHQLRCINTLWARCVQPAINPFTRGNESIHHARPPARRRWCLWRASQTGAAPPALPATHGEQPCCSALQLLPLLPVCVPNASSTTCMCAACAGATAAWQPHPACPLAGSSSSGHTLYFVPTSKQRSWLGRVTVRAGGRPSAWTVSGKGQTRPLLDP